MAKGNTLRGQTSVTLGGQEHEVLLNMNAFRLMTQDRGIELGDLDDFVSKNPLEFVPCVVFWGIMNAADFAGQDRPEIKFDHVAAAVCADMDKFNVLSSSIGESLGVEVGETEGNE